MKSRTTGNKTTLQANGDIILDQRDLFTGRTLREEIATVGDRVEQDEKGLCPYCKKQPRHRLDQLTLPCCDNEDCRNAYQTLCVVCNEKKRVSDFVCDGAECVETFRN